jgi:hypothetical protein
VAVPGYAASVTSTELKGSRVAALMHRIEVLVLHEEVEHHDEIVFVVGVKLFDAKLRPKSVRSDPPERGAFRCTCEITGESKENFPRRVPT